MKLRQTSSLLFSAVLVAFSVSGMAINNQTDDAKLLMLQSILKREKDVFASNAAGLYRADLSGKTWKQLSIPDSMPVNGYFADQPTNSRLVLYFKPKRITTETENAKTEVCGLYMSQDDGLTWRLISRKDDYSRVFLHPNGNLFAVTNAGNFMGPARIFMSKNLGESWRDITGKSFGQIFAIFSDPDHPDLICLGGNGIRNYIFQATDENYDWEATREWEWWPKRQTEERFLSRFYSTRTTLYMLQATILNYFAHDFGQGVTLPGFDIAPQKSAYEFGKDQAKVIQVSVPFLPEPVAAEAPEKRGHGFWDVYYPPPTITIVDQKSGLDLWGLNVVDPDGKRTNVQPKISKSVYESIDQDSKRQQLRETAGLQAQEISQGKPYKRMIDLSQLYNFSVPGAYKVQLIYESVCLSDPVQGEWIGDFRGRVFTVTIR